MSITSDGAVGFAGLSHLGIVSSIVAAAKGFSVVGWDLDADLVSQVQSGSLPIVEPGLDDLLAEHREQLMFTADISALSACRLVYVAQDVPTDDSGRSNLDAVNDLLQRVGVAVKPGTIVVLLSQVPPGFTREAAAELISNSLGSGPELFYQVETLVFGNAVERALTPERIIVGCPNPGVDRPEALTRYLGAFDCPILPMRYESAELCKIAINMFLVSTLATTNMLAELCEMIGAVWEEIAPALRLDRRIGRYAYLNPGLGVGGGNLLRDVATVQKTAARHQVDTQLLDAWLANSDHRRDWVLRAIRHEVLPETTEPVVAVWGLAYKENTGSTFRSPALRTIEQLNGVAVRAYDPAVVLNDDRFDNFSQSTDPISACQDADVLAIMTPWPQFKSVQVAEVAAAMKGAVVIDPYGVLPLDEGKANGLRIFRLGASPPPSV